MHAASQRPAPLLLITCLVLGTLGLAERAEARDRSSGRSSKSSRDKAPDAPGAKDAPASDPATYPDEKGFQKRAQRVIESAAKRNLATYRRGWWVGNGDPGKYTIPICIAKQRLDPDDKEAIALMGDERSVKEHYHFAAIGWSRYLGLFGDTLPKATRDALRSKGGGALAGGVGTDNHECMWRTSAILYAQYDMQGNAGAGKAWLRDYVANLYAVGQPEWNSSRYVPWSMMGFLNLYDFTEDEEVRLLAKAALDWWAACYAQRYVNGLQAGPSERALYLHARSADIDLYGWLWFGGDQPAPDDKNLWIAIHGATSTYRPNEVICNLAARGGRIKLPYEARNTKPNYWSGLDTKPIAPVAGAGGYETLWVSEAFTLGTLWYGEDICAQVGRLQAAFRVGDGAVGLTGGTVGRQNGELRWTEGQGTILQHAKSKAGKEHPITRAIYPQFCQVGNVTACIAVIPEDDPHPFTFVSIPSGSKATKSGDGWSMAVGESRVYVLPLTKEGRGGAKINKTKAFSYLMIPGRVGGFLLLVTDKESKGDLRDLEKRLETKDLEKKGVIAFRVPDGRDVRMTYTRPTTPGGKAVSYSGQRGSFQVHPDQVEHRPAVEIEGEAVDYDDAPVHASPYLYQADGVLLTNDGKEGYTIDLSRAKPRYKPWDGKLPGGEDKKKRRRRR